MQLFAYCGYCVKSMPVPLPMNNLLPADKGSEWITPLEKETFIYYTSWTIDNHQPGRYGYYHLMTASEGTETITP